MFPLLLWLAVRARPAPPEVKPRAILEKEVSSIREVDVSADGRVLAYSTGYSQIHLIDPRTDKRLASLQPKSESRGWVLMRLSENGKTLVLGGGVFQRRDQEDRVWPRIVVMDVASQKELRCIDLPPGGLRVDSCQWDFDVTRDGQRLVASGSPGRVQRIPATQIAEPKVLLYDLTTGKQIANFQCACGHGARPSFSPDGKTLAFACSNGLIELWDVAPVKLRASLKRHVYQPTLAFSPDSKSLASMELTDRELVLWDAKEGKELGKVNTRRNEPSFFMPLLFSPDGKSLASIRSDRYLQLWDLEERSLRKDFLGRRTTGNSEGMLFFPDGKTLATWGLQGKTSPGIWLWDVPQRQPRPQPKP